MILYLKRPKLMWSKCSQRAKRLIESTIFKMVSGRRSHITGIRSGDRGPWRENKDGNSGFASKAGLKMA